MTVARFAIPNSAGLAAQSFPSAFPSYLVLAPQSYSGVLSIQVALAQALSANPVQVHTGAAGGNPTGTGGASGSTGYVPWQSITDHGTVSWQSITDHGTASSQGTSTTAVTVLHVTQTQESLTSLPANVSVGGLVAITLQISSGGGQEAPPARLDARADMRAEVSSSATRANSYGSAGQAGGAAPQTSEPAQATSNIAAAVLEVVNI